MAKRVLKAERALAEAKADLEALKAERVEVEALVTAAVNVSEALLVSRGARLLNLDRALAVVADRVAVLEIEAKAARKRAAVSRARSQALRDLGLVRTRYGWE